IDERDDSGLEWVCWAVGQSPVERDGSGATATHAAAGCACGYRSAVTTIENTARSLWPDAWDHSGLHQACADSVVRLASTHAEWSERGLRIFVSVCLHD